MIDLNGKSNIMEEVFLLTKEETERVKEVTEAYNRQVSNIDEIYGTSNVSTLLYINDFIKKNKIELSQNQKNYIIYAIGLKAGTDDVFMTHIYEE